MIIYAVMPEPGNVEGYWTFEKALSRQAELEKQTGVPCGLAFVHLEGLDILINRYYEFRGLHDVTAQESLNFVFEEVGELSRAFNRNDKWVRNNPRDKEESIGEETGDVLMMMTKLTEKCGIGDPIYQMLNKMRIKGFIDEQDNIEAINEKDKGNGDPT